ncbi:uncharacterized protein [Montipora foliosa]|uniref:uncharacterized protein isoform X2 n=1 Tax=Montipora foliosa TaxID=591990 RepID=UPI0035F1E594
MSLLHYITYKLVVIRDRRIGFIYYTIAVAIVLYTLAEIFVKKGYLEFDTSPESTMRFLLSDPREDNDSDSGETSSFEGLSYCCNQVIYYLLVVLKVFSRANHVHHAGFWMQSSYLGLWNQFDNFCKGLLANKNASFSALDNLQFKTIRRFGADADYRMTLKFRHNYIHLYFSCST